MAMNQYDETNRGAIWRNDKKETDKHPDFKGNLNVEGVEYWVSAWKKDPEGNPKAPSLRFSIQKKEDVHNQGVEKATQAIDNTPEFASPTDFDDDIPF